MLLYVILIATYANALNIPWNNGSDTHSNIYAKLESYDQTYFKDIKLTRLYKKRVFSGYKFECTALKVIEKDLWFIFEYHVFKNNEYHIVSPMTVSLSLKELYEYDFAGVGTGLKETFGDTFPIPLGKHTIMVDLDPRKTLPLPIFGQFKILLKVMDTKLCVMELAWYGRIEKTVTPKCRNGKC